MKHLRRTRLNQKAFTIIELMIATSVLSTILLLVTVMMINIGNLYYKGINQARVQDDVRSISDELGQHLQLSDQGPKQAATPMNVTISGHPYTINAYCIDNTRYSYVINVQVGNSPSASNPQIPHVLWRDPTPSTGCMAPANLNSAGLSGGTELIAPNSRLTDFTISPLTSPYGVSVGVAYGSDDLLNLHGITTTCKGAVGDQFCSTATLTTIVVQRITPSGG
jgi:prepilin-type N-terminal cleavage/methylation domain-containing protein